jgi:hypothetical protein
MDYTEFEKLAADYVEGRLPGKLQRQMDEARLQNPELDALVRRHEQVLTALAETPEAVFPEGLSLRILAATEERDRMLARENSRFRTSMVFWSSLSAIAIAAGSALCCIFQNNLAAVFVKTGVLKNMKLLDFWAVSPKLPSSTTGLLIFKVPVPGTGFGLPAVYILAFAILAVTLWYYREKSVSF